MGLDIRVPIGLMFTIIGLILVLFGAATSHSAIYSRSLGINVNLGWGGVMLGFGLFMLLVAFLARRRAGGK
jgi:hypothetical protein